MNAHDAAVLLGVAENADRAAIEEAYRDRARLVHPDRFADASEVDRDSAGRERARLGEAHAALLAVLPGTAMVSPTEAIRPAPVREPRAEKTREQYVAEMWAEQWTSTSSLRTASAPVAAGATSGFSPPPPAAPRPTSPGAATTPPTGNGGKVLALVASLAGIVAVIVIVAAIVANGRGATDSASEGTQSSFGSDSVDFDTRFLTDRAIDANGGCLQDDCWMWEVSTESDCSPADHWAEVSFSRTAGGPIVSTRRYRLADLNDYASQVLVVDGDAPDVEYAGVSSVYCG